MEEKRRLRRALAWMLALAMLIGMVPLTAAYAAEEDEVAYIQVTNLADISAEKQYVLAVWRYFGGTNEDSTNAYLLHSVNDGTMRAQTADGYATLTYAVGDGVIPDTALWKLSGSGTEFTIQNVATQRYLGEGMSYDSDTGVAYTFVSGTSGGYLNFAAGLGGSSIRY